MHQIRLEQFEGPLDLLLQLIEKDKLQITEISLAHVTDQFLAYIEKNQNLANEEVADFLLIAAKLIYIKSKYLLPNLDIQDEADASTLERQLKIYRQYYEASHVINRLFNDKKRYALPKIAPFKKFLPTGFIPPKNVTASILADVFKDLLRRVEAVVNLPKVALKRAISIGDKIRHIQEIIKQKAKDIDFWHLVKDKKDKTEVLVSFLAMLELVKQREIAVEQNSLFGNLKINKN